MSLAQVACELAEDVAAAEREKRRIFTEILHSVRRYRPENPFLPCLSIEHVGTYTGRRTRTTWTIYHGFRNVHSSPLPEWLGFGHVEVAGVAVDTSAGKKYYFMLPNPNGDDIKGYVLSFTPHFVRRLRERCGVEDGVSTWRILGEFIMETVGDPALNRLIQNARVFRRMGVHHRDGFVDMFSLTPHGAAVWDSTLVRDGRSGRSFVIIEYRTFIDNGRLTQDQKDEMTRIRAWGLAARFHELFPDPLAPHAADRAMEFMLRRPLPYPRRMRPARFRDAGLPS